MKLLSSYTMLFDDVAFGIAVKDARKAQHLSQHELAQKVGFSTGGAISRIETARETDSITVRRYMTLCNVLNLNPMHYWDIDPSREGRWDRIEQDYA